MTKRCVQLFALAAVVSAVGAVSGLARGGADKKAPDAALLSQLEGYKSWARVKLTPVLSVDASFVGG